MRRLTAAVLMAVFLAVAGCGDDDESEGGNADKTLTRREFVTKANAICQAGEAKIDELSEKRFAGLSEDETLSDAEVKEFVLSQVVPIIREEQDDIRSLKPPADMAAEVGEALDATDEAIDNAVKRIETDPDAFSQSGDDLFQDVNDKFDALGLTDCTESDAEEEFFDLASIICREGNERIDHELESQLGDSATVAELGAFMNDDLVPEIQTQIDDLRALEPPEEISGELEDILLETEDLLVTVRDRAAEDPASAVSIDPDPFQFLSRQLDDLGVEGCLD